jgi:hypothetical protein
LQRENLKWERLQSRPDADDWADKPLVDFGDETSDESTR